MAKKIQYINLLRHQEKSAVDKFLDWAFTVGRAIVIITESVALSAFAYRFVLDRQIIDLKDKIKQEQAIVKLSQPNEFKFRNLQGRLAEARILDEQSSSKITLLTEILKPAQGKISFKTLAITDKAVSMDGIVPSAKTVSIFAQELRNIPGVSRVTIGEIGTNTATGVTSVGIVADLTQPSPAATSMTPQQGTLTPTTGTQ
ncbi:MAG: hypothetical protein RLZZ455_445 [Candidatus Parcubacteria bacterium]|jgi:hypothetical protein